MTQHAAVPPAPDGPIADVSYRNYDGPLLRHPFRPWIIARAMLRMFVRRWPYWVFAVFASLPYLLGGFLLYLQQQVATQAPIVAAPEFNQTFYHAFGQGQFWIFLLALLVGAASIAGDNRTNALQIYLSKPMTKNDYLAGKWLGLFFALLAPALVPALVLYLYCALSYAGQGFFKDYPYLIVQLLAMTSMQAALHASLIIGISAWFKRPLLAGGLYAAFYVGSRIVLLILSMIVFQTGKKQLATTITSLSPSGILWGLAGAVYDGEPTFMGLGVSNPNGVSPEDILTPTEWVLWTALGVLIVLGIAMARFRVRAVDVVTG
ncbi:MAG: ABC transporter permease [Armatimonadota bacterium]